MMNTIQDYKQYVTIHSEDRDMVKYPNASDFFIELPESLNDVKSVTLTDWWFPNDVENIFSEKNNNLTLFFGTIDLSGNEILYDIQITEGNYTPTQLCFEIQERMNFAIKDIFNLQFQVLFHEVSKKVFFRTTTNNFSFYFVNSDSHLYNNLNLYYRLGFDSFRTVSTHDPFPNFFYTQPPTTYVTTSYIESTHQLNIQGQSHMYMEINGYDTINETSPYVLSTFTSTTNSTNGRINSAFAKIPIDQNVYHENKKSNAYTLFQPRQNNIRRLKIKLRYHNNTLVDFGSKNYTFSLEFTMLR